MINLTSLFPTTKTASQATAPTGAAPRTGGNPVQDAIREVSEGAMKLASANGTNAPIADVEKVAQEVAARDHERGLKEAQEYGRGICDGFMAQLALYEKVAQETEKAATDAYTSTATAVEGQIHKLASAHYVTGYETAKALVS